jgi:amino acid adenylation domain-containing protein
LDRRALPAPDQSRPELDEAFVSPQTELERLVAGIWANILKLERVGVYDNFFELGGHSLLATQIMSRIREAVQVELPLRALFETPTVAGLAEQIQSRHADPAEANQPIQRRPIEGPIPLSYTQQRLWFLDQFDPGTATYNSPAAARLRGSLNIPALEQSVNEILRRHDGLRTQFTIVEGQPRQVIRPYQPLALRAQDLSHLSEEEREAEARRLVEEEARRPFDLSNDLLFRFELLRLGENDHIAMMTMHHIICDGWSYIVFARELAMLYTAFIKDEPSPLSPLPIQYPDFAIWQREWLQSEALSGQLAYWKQQLGGKLPVLELPTDYLRPPVQTYREARHISLLSPALSQALDRLCRQEGVTLFMLLLAAFKLLLQRYTGQEDIIVGSPIAGRNRVELENLIGFFINTLVLRTDLSGDISFRELLKRVRTVTLAAYANQDIPFELLLEELQPERDLSRTPLFQVFFNMFNFSDDVIDLPEVTAEGLARPEIGSKFDLTLYVEEEAEQTLLRLVYNADLFSRERMVEMLTQYEQLLTQIVANPEQKLAHFSLVTAGAKAYLPNPTQPLADAWYGSVHAAFTAQAGRVPDCEAVIDPNIRWSYQELDQSSNQLAHYLRASGIQSQDVVAIYGHRSAALVWALLGVLKAGAAFIILDPAYPGSRLIDYLHLARPRGWLQLEAAGPLPSTLEDCLRGLDCCCQLKLPHRTKTHNLLADCPTTDLHLTVGPDDLAYIAFTSGSTGKPKAIMGSHSPLSHFLQWHSQAFQLEQEDRFSMLSGLAHDPLLRDIFTPLWLGATLCIPDLGDIETPSQLALWMKRQQISVTHLTPAMAQVLTETYMDHSSQNGGDPTLASLRYAFFGGDILTKRTVGRLRQLAPGVTCVNFYGATETPQAMGYQIVTGAAGLVEQPHSALPKEGIPVGQGIADVQLLVLNPTWQLAGVGELGEIYIRTPYLAKGYKEDETLTQERFLLNPFTNGAGARDRVYKSGDLGRYLPDGNVEIVGRDDHQVKIRGFRIELEEIEAALSYHPAVRQAVVVAQEDKAQQKRLVGYIIPTPELTPTGTELRRFLKERLPEYMIPPTFVSLEMLPLTPNGKLDRAALPRPETIQSSMSDGFVGPGSDLERLIAGIWQEALGLDRVSVYDNFFDLGGYSLLSIEVITKIEQKTGVRLSPADIRRQTLGQLAATCAEQLQGLSQPQVAASRGFIHKLFKSVKDIISQ